MSKPLAVLISDVHYSLPTLELADKAMRIAIDKANDLDIPLIVAGDLHDTKANLRGECVNAMLDTFTRCKNLAWVLRGNHDALNEKSKEHSLRFLGLGVVIVDHPKKYDAVMMRHFIGNFDAHLIPYYHDPEELRNYLKTIPKGSTLIMHQGLNSSNSGHYIQDRSAINKEDVADFRVISGHYHTRQTIKTGRPRQHAVGLWDYIGNPYTLNYGEANDPPKGFQVLYDDGMLEFIPTNLRKHVVYDIELKDDCWTTGVSLDIIKDLLKEPNGDLIWVKIRGTREKLATIHKRDFPNCRLDLIPLESETSKPIHMNQTQPEILDGLIDSLTNTSDEQKTRVKNLWRGM